MPSAHAQPASVYELINAVELAKRLQARVRFIREYSRATITRDPIPNIRIHRKLRLYEWGSPDLNAWIARRKAKPLYERPSVLSSRY
jgi:hypothetical protein